jgi:TolB protein
MIFTTKLHSLSFLFLHKVRIALSGTIFFLLLPSMLHALELTIEETDDSIPITIMPISGKAGGIIEADLKRSGRLKVISSSKITGLTPFGGSVTNVEKFADITDYIVRGKPSINGGLDIELISTSDKAVTRYSISANASPRRVAHKTADKIYEKITRIKGAFDTRLAYVTVTNKASKNRMFRLYIADSDGYKPQSILSSHLPIMSPDWSPDASKLAYVSFEENNTSAIYIQNIFTGEKRKISSREGINGAPSWSPDGRRLAMSLSVSGNPEIYVINVSNGALTQITHSSAINTEPTWRNNNTLVFTSNRGGTPQLYLANASGGSVKRMSFDGRYNSAADIANNKMAYITGARGAYQVAIKSISGSGKEILSNGRLDESPTISPNGAMVVYTTLKNGENTLAVVSDNAKARQFLTSAAGDVREPAWSPYLRK